MNFIYKFLNRHRKSVITTSLASIFIFSFCWQIYTKDYLQTGLDVVFTKKTETTTVTDSDIPKRIALTFDDGPHPDYTVKLLDGLKERNVKATFFIIGESGHSYPEILQRMSSEGHIIGNHTYSHVQLTCISEESAIDEINRTNEVIANTCNIEPKYIRPPYGLFNDKLKKETNLTKVLWTVDPRDWSVLNTDKIVSHVVSRAKDGDIILLHDIFDTSVDAALKIIDELSAKGFEFVTIDEILQ